MIRSTGERGWESTHDDEAADILGKTFVETRHDEPENSLEKNADGERVFWTEIVCYVGLCTGSGEIKQENHDVPSEGFIEGLMLVASGVNGTVLGITRSRMVEL